MNISADRSKALAQINYLNSLEGLPPVEMLDGTVATQSGILWYQVVTDRGQTFFITTSLLKDAVKYDERITVVDDVYEAVDLDGSEWI